MPLNQVEDSHTANALLLMLEDQDFIFRCRVEIEEDLESRVISRKLVQIFFIPPDQIYTYNFTYKNTSLNPSKIYHWSLAHKMPSCQAHACQATPHQNSGSHIIFPCPPPTLPPPHHLPSHFHALQTRPQLQCCSCAV